MSQNVINVGGKLIGDKQAVYIIAEIGINHNGSVDLAKKLIDGAVFAGCDAVKFQKRTPELATPPDQWNIERDTPWGRMKYIDYRHKVELSKHDYEQIDAYCKQKGIHWFASPWDLPSLEFLLEFDVPLIKFSSASLTDYELLKRAHETDIPLMLSTGMSDLNLVIDRVNEFGTKKLLLAQSTSTYPCSLDELNLNVIHTYQKLFPEVPVGYSGHETGLAPTLAAVAMGASFVERHLTLDRAMWGTDHAASVEIGGMFRLVKDIRDIERAKGDGVKRVYDSELPSMLKLRKVATK
jgi:N-acetylneuraminate synthase